MSSGTLPGATYHRASHLGAGTFGSVVVVYNDDGEEYALKLFRNENDDDTTDDNHNDSDDDEYAPPQPMALGAMREISALRLLRDENRHANIVALVDVQADWTSGYSGDDDNGGAGTSGCLSVALPLSKHGSLKSAIEKNLFLGCPQAVKVRLAHGLLSAVLYLHDCGILHRDIKSDNILLERNETNDCWTPILIDFSLAKPVDCSMWNKSLNQNDTNGMTTVVQMKHQLESMTHTGEVGTLIYTAPEVTALEGYSFPSDLYSVGVVLLELVQGRLFTAEKAKHAMVEIATAVSLLPPAMPFACLIRSLLTIDQDERITAIDACNHAVFAKFGLLTTSTVTSERRIIDMASALPYESSDDDMDAENESPNDAAPLVAMTDKQRRQKLERRLKTIDKLLRDLDSCHPWTRWAALEYSEQLDQLDDSVDDVQDKKYCSQALADCCVLAHRFWELEIVDLNDLDACTTGPFAHWSLDDYVDNEATIFMLLDYCLYPRRLSL